MSKGKLSLFSRLALCCAAFFMIAGLSLGQSEPPRPLVWLGFPITEYDAQKTRFNLNDGRSFGSAFLKQLKRQALLIAARDEMGALTRDAFWSETRQEGSIDIEDINSNDILALEISVTDSDKIQANVDYPRYLAEVEQLSRTGYVEVLKKRGLTKQDFPEKSELTELPAATKKLLDDYALVPQVEALRQIHELIYTEGESLALLQGLVRGYSQAQLLQNASIRDTHRIFQARAMLYAQRAVAKYGENAETLSLRATAWSLNNFSRLARNEFAALHEKFPNAAENESDLTKIAKAYADFNIDDMRKLGDSLGEQGLRPFAKLLVFTLLVDSGNGGSMGRPYGQTLVNELPHCLRLYQNMHAHWTYYIPHSPEGTPYDEYVGARLPGAVKKMRQLPPAVVKANNSMLTAMGQRGNAPLFGGLFGGGRREQTNTYTREGYFQHLSKVLDEMNKAAPSQDHFEPSLQALAAIIQDDEFYSSILYTHKAIGHNEDSDKVIDEALPVIGTHPIFFHLGLAYKDKEKREENQRQMNAAIVPYELFSEVSLSFEISGSERWGQGKFYVPFFFVCTLADRENVRDMIYYQQHAAWRSPRGMPIFPIDILRELCPNNPFTINEYINRGWTFNLEEAKAFTRQFKGYPNFRDSITRHYRENNLESLVTDLKIEDLKANPRRDLAEELAIEFLKRGDREKAVETLKAYTDSPQAAEQWYDRLMAMLRIGDILMEDGKIKEAEPYYTAIARAGTQWGMRRLAAYYEMTGRQEEAETLSRQCMKAYPNEGPVTLWATCLRGNSPNLDALTAEVFEYHADPKDANAKYHPLLNVAYCMGEKQEEWFGKNAFVDGYFEADNPVSGFMGYFDMLKKGEKEKAAILLKMLRHQFYAVSDADLALLSDGKIKSHRDYKVKFLEPYHIVAAIIAVDQQSAEPGSLNKEEIEHLLRRNYQHTLEQGRMHWLLYVLGRYYEACGNFEDAFDCYDRCIQMRSNFDVLPRTLAVHQLRKNGMEQEEYFAIIEGDPRLPTSNPSFDTANVLCRQLFRNFSENPVESQLAQPVADKPQKFEDFGSTKPFLSGYYRVEDVRFRGASSKVPLAVWWHIPENAWWATHGTAHVGEIKTERGQQRSDGAYPVKLGEKEPLSALVSFFSEGKMVLTISLKPGVDPPSLTPPPDSDCVTVVLQRE